jgi:hypothetical protein
MGSSLSKLADKNFVIGFFIPSLLFFAALRGAYGCTPWLASICGTSTGDLFKDLTLFAIAVWVVGILLVAANYSLYRFLEGYHLPASWSTALRARSQARVQRLVDREEALKRQRAARWHPQERRRAPSAAKASECHSVEAPSGVSRDAG